MAAEQPRERELEELKELVSALRDSIVELKATLMDVVSPFSKMRVGEEERPEEEALEPVSSQIRLAPAPVTAPAEARPQEAQAPRAERAAEAARQAARSEAAERPAGAPPRAAQQPAIGLRKALKVIKLLYKLSQSVPSQNLETYIQFMKTIGLIDERAEEVLMTLKKMVDVGTQSGIDAEDQIIAIYSIAKMLGVTDPELEEEIAFSLAERLRREGGK